jgi:hypothetical protein
MMIKDLDIQWSGPRIWRPVFASFDGYIYPLFITYIFNLEMTSYGVIYPSGEWILFWL